ncbi:MAG: MFS transporter [Dermatophilaceae bacterium]
MALHVGKLPPAVPTLTQEWGISLVQAGFLLSLVQFAGMVLGLAIGVSADGIGLRRSMLIGLSILTAASVAGGFASSYPVLLVLRALEGLGLLMAAVPAPGLLRRVVTAGQVTRVLGIWGAYIPFGTGMAFLIGPWVIGHGSWSLWWWLLAATTALSLAAVAFVVPPDPPRVAGTRRSAGATARVRLTLGSAGPWTAALAFGVYAAQWMAVIGFLPSLYAAAGWVGAVGALLTSVVPWVNVIGNVVAGVLLHRGWRPRSVLVLGFAGQAVGTILAFASVTEAAPVVRFAGALVFSMVGGLVPGALFAVAPRVAPDEGTISTTIGLIQQLSSAGQVIGPPAVAWLASRVGGFQWTWAACLGCCLLGAALAAVLDRKTRAHT